MSKIVIYGDIHGCLEEFEEIRKLIPKNTEEWCVGDLIDRGPYDTEVFDYLRKNKINSVLGNHEYKHIRKYKGHKVKLDDNQKEVYSHLKKEDFEFMAKMPHFFRKNNLTILHAGVSNKTSLDKFDEKILYYRYVDENEDFLPLHHNNPNAIYWAKIYNGHLGFIVNGHQPLKEVTKFPNSVGIDTGCVFGNRLSAIIINDTSKPWEYEVVSVQSKKEYSSYYKELPTFESI